jgi:TolB-like protein/DNA-binding winged helix-turn-helix (wHTH) protein
LDFPVPVPVRILTRFAILNEVNPSRKVLGFGPFQVDLTTHELRKFGTRVRIPEQSFQILSVLLESQGELITREALRSRLWPPHTYVDFERSLTVAVNRLRAALADSAEKPRYIETLPRLGYRFISPVEVVANGRRLVSGALAENEAVRADSSVSSVGNIPPTTASRPWFSRPPFLLLISLAVAAACLAALVSGRWHRRSARPRQIDSIAVLPFVNSAGDANTDYLSDGITEALIRNLVRVPDLKVKSRTSVFEYKGKDVDIRKVGSDLGVAALVSGRVMPRGAAIEVSAELIDARDNTEIWGQHYSYSNAEIITLQQRIVGDIAQKIRSTLSTSLRERVAMQGTQNADAYESYLKGRYYWNKRTVVDLERAVSYFNQAIAKDPDYALAYSGLADAYAILATYGGNPKQTYAKSNAAAFRALELDSSMAHPHAVLGSAEMEYDWDFAAGEAEYKKSFELDPDDATAHHWYAQDIGWLGRSDEAVAEVNLAQQLEPSSFIVTTEVGMVDLTARKFDDAVATCSKVANENPAFAQAHSCLALAYWGKHMYPKVVEEWKAFGELSRDQNDIDLATAMEQGFRAGNWKDALRKSIEIREVQRRRGYMSAYAIAALHADLGNKDDAFRWLNIAFQERDVYLVGMRTDFLLDPLRSDPRFAELSRKMGLEKMASKQQRRSPEMP